MILRSDMDCCNKQSTNKRYLIIDNYPPQKSCEGYVFTPVCQLFCSQGGVCLSACWDATPSREQTPPPGTRHPPLGADHPQQTATAADGTHPTGMHSC